MAKKDADKKTEALPVKTDERGIRRIGGIPEDTVQQMEAVVEEYGVDKLTARPGEMFGPMLRMAEGIVRLRELLTDDVMKAVMVLQCSQLGFLTDKDKSGGYPVGQVKDAWIEATLMGARPIGNEFNIISAKAYLTLNNFKRKVRELPGLTDLDVKMALKAEAVKPGTTIDVPYHVTWKLDGKPMEIEGTFPVRVNQGMGADAVLGKTHRKVLNLVWQKVTGSTHTLPEGDIQDCDIPDAVDTTGSVLKPGKHNVRRSASLPASSGVEAEQQAEPQGQEEEKLAFKVTAGMIYEVEQAALASSWDMAQLAEWIEGTYNALLKDIKAQMAYDEILLHVKTETPDGKAVNA